MRQSTIFSAVLVASVLLLIFLLADVNAFTLRTLESRHASHLAYDSRSSKQRPYETIGTVDPSYSALEIDPETGLIRDLKVRDFRISMKLEARRLDHYPNVFQTAPLNRGLRVELTGPILALIAASATPDGVEAIFISTNFTADQPHTLDLTVDTQKRLVIRFDNHIQVDAVHPELAYEISNVIVGSGFGLERPFSGRIDDAAFSYGIYRLNPSAAAVRVDLIALLLVIATVCAYFVFGPERRSKLHWPWLDRPVRSRRTLSPHERWLSPAEEVRRYVWALPGDGAAELLLERRHVTFRALDSLALQLEDVARVSPGSDGALGDSAVEYSLRLPDNVRATLRFVDGDALQGRALLRLAHNLRELARFVEP